MDLETLVTQQLFTPTSKKAVKDLLPKQQQNRSYTNTTIVKEPKLNLIAERYLIDEYKGEWMLWFNLSWPGAFSPSTPRVASKKQLNDFALDYIKSRSYMGDEKYFKIKMIDTKKMQIIFDIDKWLKDAFGTVHQRFSPPMSLIYKSKKKLPDLVFSNSSLTNLNIFISRKFSEFIKPNKLKHKEFGFIKKFNHDLFDYTMSFRDMKITATLKFSVVLASLAGYMIWKHQKDLNKKEITSLKRKASNMKDVKHLERYIKRL